jgi:hypothetical protein
MIFGREGKPSPRYFPAPGRPSSGMCEAQRIDLAAAQAGKITWRQYFARWGPS